MVDDELKREVDEAMRRERWQALWKQFGDKIIYLSIGVILFTAAVVFWQNHTLKTLQSRTDQIITGHELYSQGRYKEARDVFAEVTAESKGKLKTLAHIWLAKSELELGEADKALDALAGSIPSPLKIDALVAYACIQGAMMAPQDERFTACLPSRDGDPFYAMAQEMTAVDAIAGGEIVAADTLPEGVLLPQTQQRRIMDLKSFIASSGDAGDAE